MGSNTKKLLATRIVDVIEVDSDTEQKLPINSDDAKESNDDCSFLVRLSNIDGKNRAV